MTLIFKFQDQELTYHLSTTGALLLIQLVHKFELIDVIFNSKKGEML